MQVLTGGIAMGVNLKRGDGYVQESYVEKHALTGLYYNNAFF